MSSCELWVEAGDFSPGALSSPRPRPLRPGLWPTATRMWHRPLLRSMKRLLRPTAGLSRTRSVARRSDLDRPEQVCVIQSPHQVRRCRCRCSGPKGAHEPDRTIARQRTVMEVVAVERPWSLEGASEPAREFGIGEAGASCSHNVIAGGRSNRSSDAGPGTGWNCNRGRGR